MINIGMFTCVYAVVASYGNYIEELYGNLTYDLLSFKASASFVQLIAISLVGVVLTLFFGQLGGGWVRKRGPASGSSSIHNAFALRCPLLDSKAWFRLPRVYLLCLFLLCWALGHIVLLRQRAHIGHHRKGNGRHGLQRQPPADGMDAILNTDRWKGTHDGVHLFAIRDRHDDVFVYRGAVFLAFTALGPRNHRATAKISYLWSGSTSKKRFQISAFLGTFICDEGSLLSTKCASYRYEWFHSGI